MADLATLQIKVDTTDLARAKKDLGEFEKVAAATQNNINKQRKQSATELLAAEKLAYTELSNALKLSSQLEIAESKAKIAQNNAEISSLKLLAQQKKATASIGGDDSGYTASGIANIDKRRLATAELAKRTIELNAAHAAGLITMKEFGIEQKKITAEQNLAIEGNSRHRGAIRQTAAAMASLTFEMTGAIYGVAALGTAFAAPGIVGIKLQKSMEDAQAAITGILLSMGQIDGKSMNVGDGWKIAGAYIKEVHADAMRLGIDMDKLVNVNRAVMAPGLAAGLELKQIKQLATEGAVAVSMIGLNSTQYVQEIRDLIAGGIQPASSTLATALGITDKVLKDWKSQGPDVFFNNLHNSIKGFAQAADELRKSTLSGAWEIMMANFRNMMVDPQAFRGLVGAINEVSDAIASPQFASIVEKYWNTLKGVATVLWEIVNVMAQLLPIAINVGEALLSMWVGGKIATGIAFAAEEIKGITFSLAALGTATTNLATKFMAFGRGGLIGLALLGIYEFADFTGFIDRIATGAEERVRRLREQIIGSREIQSQVGIKKQGVQDSGFNVVPGLAEDASKSYFESIGGGTENLLMSRVKSAKALMSDFDEKYVTSQEKKTKALAQFDRDYIDHIEKFIKAEHTVDEIQKESARTWAKRAIIEEDFNKKKNEKKNNEQISAEQSAMNSMYDRLINQNEQLTKKTQDLTAAEIVALGIKDALAKKTEDVTIAMLEQEAQKGIDLAKEKEKQDADEKSIKSMNDRTSQIIKETAALKKKTEQLGMTKEQIAADNAARTQQQLNSIQSIELLLKETEATDGLMNVNLDYASSGVEAMAGLSDEQRKAAREWIIYLKEMQKAQAEYAQKSFVQDLIDENKKYNKELQNALEHPFKNLFKGILNGSKDTWVQMRDSLKNIFFDFLYEMTAKKFIINTIIGTTGIGAVTNAAGESMVGAGVGAAAGSGLAGWIGTSAITATALSGGVPVAGSAITAGGTGLMGGGLAGAWAASPAITIAAGAIAAGVVAKYGFGFGNSREYGAQRLEGTIGSTGINARTAQDWKLSGGWFGRSSSGTDYGSLTQAQIEALNSKSSAMLNIFGDLGMAIGDLNLKTREWSADVNKMSEGITMSIIPALKQFQKAGEDLADTAKRMATAFSATNNLIVSLGVSSEQAFGSFGISSGTSRNALIEQAGGIDAFSQSFSTFISSISSESDKLNISYAEIGRVFTSLNLAVPDTKEQFADLVRTAIGNGEYSTVAALMKVSGAFGTVASSAISSAQQIASITSNISSSYQGFVQRAATTYSAVKAAQQAITDGYLSSQQRVAAAQQKVADISRQAAQEMAGLSDNIRKFLSQMRTTSLGGSSGENQFATLYAGFTTTMAMARAGDKTALGNVTGQAQSLLEMKRGTASSAFEYAQFAGQLAGSLESLATISDAKAGPIAEAIDPMAQAVNELAAAQEDAAKWQEAVAESGASTAQSVTDYAAAWRDAVAADKVAQAELAAATLLTQGIEMSQLTELQKLSGLVSELKTLQSAALTPSAGAAAMTRDLPAEAIANAAANDMATFAAGKMYQVQALLKSETERIAKEAERIANFGGEYTNQAVYGPVAIQNLNSDYVDPALYSNPVIQNIPLYASGGYHDGGLRIVGENGPELEYTPPSYISSNNATTGLFGGITEELASVRRELEQLRAENKAGQVAIARNTSRSAKVLEQFDGDGMPATRVI